MSRTLGFFGKVARRPLEAIEALLAFILFVSGLWLMSPFYTPDTSAAYQITHSSEIAQVLGAVQVIIGIVLFYALAHFDWPWRQMIRSVVTFTIFLLFLFYSFSQMILFHLHRITWVTTLGLALISGVAHLCLKVKEDEQH